MSNTPPPKGRPDARRREPLWDRVDRNRFRLVGYLMLFSVVSTVWIAACYWLVFLVLSLVFEPLRGSEFTEFWFGLVVGTALSVAYVLVTLARSERWLLARLDAILVPKGHLLESKMALKDMAIAAGMPVAPTFYYLPSNNTNAFVFKAIGRRPIVGVTSGLFERMSEDEQRAIFANLVARLVNGDVIVASAMTALLAPLEAWRDHRISKLDDEFEFLQVGGERQEFGDRSEYVRTSKPVSPDFFLLVFPFGVALIVLGELIAAAHRASQLTAAEKADAEGMLLLKDPQAMLSALEDCIRLDNVVPMAGESLGQLFYCWTGDSTDDEDDPEWARVARLREVLGVEGHVASDAPLPETAFAPPPPRMSG